MAKFDSKLSWLVCLSAFLSNLIIIGFTFTVSIYYVEFLTVFEQSKGTTSWVSSLNFGTLALTGPFASLMIHRWGSRATMFAGGLVAAAGLMMSAFATHFYTVILTFGILNGMGMGLSYAVTVVNISVYFVKYRPLALGLSLSGAGLGNFVMPWFSAAMIEAYGWRGALIISCGLMLNICVLAMLVIGETEMKKIPHAATKSTSLPEKELKDFDQNNTVALDHMDHINENDKCPNTQYVVIQSPSEEKEKLFKTKGAHLKEKRLLRERRHSVLNVKQRNFRLVRSLNFVLLFISTVLFFFGTSIVFGHVLPYVESQGMSFALGKLVVSVIGITTLVGRIVLGMLSQMSCTNTVLLHIICVFICGISVFIMMIWTSHIGLMLSSIIFGFFVASFGPTVAECGAILTSRELFNFAYGYLLVSMGTGWTLGAPAGGMVYDYTDHYQNSFYLGGAAIVAGSLIMTPVLFRHDRGYNVKRAGLVIRAATVMQRITRTPKATNC